MVQNTVSSLKAGEASEARISYRTRHRDRREIWMETALRATRSPDTGAVDGVVAISRDVTEHKALENRLADLATKDGLTGLANRRHFDERLEAEWSRAMRDGLPLSLILIDVDNFKKFNDCYGHPAGDACLKRVAEILAQNGRRPADLVARYGGEEFVLLLPNTEASGCTLIGEAIRNDLRDIAMLHALNLPSKRATVSLGAATTRGMEKSGGSGSLVLAADRALYQAKERGRDRLVLADPVACDAVVLQT
jgi:diguanylate cyclase (GGDEF)-like protein